MKSISNFADLEAYGIIALTGEADNLGFRLLCDLTKAGEHLVRITYGLAHEGGFNESWNQGSEKDPHISSVMLDVLGSVRTLAIMALTQIDKCHTVLITENVVYGLETGDEYVQAEWKRDEELDTYVKVGEDKLITTDFDVPIPWPKHCYGEIIRIIRPLRAPSVGDRNVHAFSGRVV